MQKLLTQATAYRRSYAERCVASVELEIKGEAVDTIPSFVKECGASLLITDFLPLRQVRRWKEEITMRVSDSVSIHEVDAHNIVPLWMISDKIEDYARTIR
ncbi:putative deoxyribodipyrimidine photo-lyase [Helianthus anomalus]